MKSKHVFWVLLCLTSCATQGIPQNTIPGFWTGYLHGALIFFSLIAETFMDNVRIYAYPNSGVSYDFGFFLGTFSLIYSFISYCVKIFFDSLN